QEPRRRGPLHGLPARRRRVLARSARAGARPRRGSRTRCLTILRAASPPGRGQKKKSAARSRRFFIFGCRGSLSVAAHQLDQGTNGHASSTLAEVAALLVGGGGTGNVQVDPWRFAHELLQ